jgi:hypothetical protein
MTAEYEHKGKFHRFEARTPPDQLLKLTVRSCPSSPAVELALSLVGVDQERHLAVYVVLEERPAPASR